MKGMHDVHVTVVAIFSLGFLRKGHGASRACRDQSDYTDDERLVCSGGKSFNNDYNS